MLSLCYPVLENQASILVNSNVSPCRGGIISDGSSGCVIFHDWMTGPCLAR